MYPAFWMFECIPAKINRLLLWRPIDYMGVEFIKILEVPGSIFRLRAKFELRNLWKFSSVNRRFDDALDHTYFQ